MNIKIDIVYNIQFNVILVQVPAKAENFQFIKKKMKYIKAILQLVLAYICSMLSIKMFHMHTLFD